MRFTLKAVVLGLAATASASSWFPGSKAAYNKWHETELERWLSDHDVPYPTPADRKDLEDLVKDNWQSNVVDPIAKVDTKVSDHYGGVKDWVFDSWTESTLKSFLDHNKITVPQPRSRDKLLTAARQNYDSIAKKAGEYSQYPGDWLYKSWSESDLKEFLDTRGIPAPQPTSRDKLIATIRRNARLASLQSASAMKEAQKSASSASASMSKSAAGAAASLQDYVYDSWTDSKLKAFLDEHGIPVPQGSKKNEMVALARKNAAKLSGNSASQASASGSSAYGAASASGASAYGAATSSADNIVAQATDAAANAAHALFGSAVETWSDSRLKAYLDARGVPIPQGGKRDELLSSVRLNQHKASTGWSAWTFDTWSVENLQKYLESTGKKFKKGTDQNRDELVQQAQAQYSSASKVGGTQFASATDYLAKQTDAAKDTVFDTWSDSDLKAYLDSFGLKTYQGSTSNELKAEARKQYNYFKHGTNSPSGTIFAKIQGGFQYVLNMIRPYASSASATLSASGSSASNVANKSASSAASVASASASSAASAASKSGGSAASAYSKDASNSASAASASAKSAASQGSASVNSFKSEL